MTHARWLRWATCPLIILATSIAVAGRSATEEIFRILPDDIAACVIIQDLAKLTQSSASSSIVARVDALPTVQRWKQSPEYHAFEQFLAFMPIYFGVSNKELVEDVFGESVVLAFRPAKDDQPSAGLLACRARNEATVAKVIDRLVSPTPHRQVNRFEYRGVAYHERRELGRRDFLLRMGSIVVLAGDARTIESTIQLSQGEGRPLANNSVFENMFGSAPKNAHLQLLLQTQAFNPLVAAAAEQAEDLARPFAQIVSRVWAKCDWLSLSITIGDPCECELRTSIKAESLTPVERRWLEHIEAPSSIVDRMPADILAFAATPVDFPSLGRAVHDIGGLVSELQPLLDAVEQLPVGISLENDLLQNLGPDLGVIVRQSESGASELLVEVQLQQARLENAEGLSLPQTIELTLLHPLLVFFSVDHKNITGEASRVETIPASGHRIHVLRGATKLPFQMEPAFVVEPNRILVGTSPDALIRWMEKPAARWVEGRQAHEYRESARQDEVLKAYVDVARLSLGITSPQKGLAQEISERSGVDEKKLASEINDLYALLSIIDFATLSTSTEGNVRIWTLRLFPSASSADRSDP